MNKIDINGNVVEMTAEQVAVYTALKTPTPDEVKNQAERKYRVMESEFYFRSLDSIFTFTTSKKTDFGLSLIILPDDGVLPWRDKFGAQHQLTKAQAAQVFNDGAVFLRALDGAKVLDQEAADGGTPSLANLDTVEAAQEVLKNAES